MDYQPTNDEFQIVQAFEKRLEELTFNSKPIINSLTMFADEHKKASKEISATIARKLPGDSRLPTLYLVDSILKNVGGIYIDHFSLVIENLFLTTFQEVTHGNIKRSLLHLLKTWIDYRIFSTMILNHIEEKIQNITAATKKPHPSESHMDYRYLQNKRPKYEENNNENLKRPRSPSYPPPEPVVRSDKLSQIWSHLENQIRQRPDLLSIFNDLRRRVEYGLPIRTAIDHLTTLLANPPKHTPHYYETSNHHPITPPVPNPNPPSIAQMTSVTHTQPPKTNPLIDTLSAIGPTIAKFKSSSGNISIPPYPSKKMNIDSLKTRDITVINSLFQNNLQCKICALRLPSHQVYAFHLDWHFRLNQKNKHHTGIHSRNYYLTIEEWVNMEKIPDETLPSSSPFNSSDNNDNISTDEIFYTVAKDENQSSSCYICGDIFDPPFWDDESSCWMYKGVMKVENIGENNLCHQHCFHDNLKNENTSSAPTSNISSVTSISSDDPIIKKDSTQSTNIETKIETEIELQTDPINTNLDSNADVENQTKNNNQSSSEKP